MTRFGWTQPCCAGCFAERNPGSRPAALKEHERELETCVYCGLSTRSGIYVRVDPKDAPHPTLVKS